MTHRDLFKTELGTLSLLPIYHASFVLTWQDLVIYVDPVGPASRYANQKSPTHILITHHHPDHFDLTLLEHVSPALISIIAPQTVANLMPDHLAGKTTILSNWEEMDWFGVQLQAVPMYNTTDERQQFHIKGEGNGYVLGFADIRIYLASDTEPTDEMRKIENIDIALFPMNLPFTMTPSQVADAIEIIRPRAVYPFHYQSKEGFPSFTPADLVPLVPHSLGTNILIRNWYPAA